MRKIDYLIVGQGLAGTILSYHLITRNKKVMVIDNGLKNTSSKVAAGIYNPLTGFRLVKTWNAENLFSYLEIFYKELEKEIGAQFLNPTDIYRPFHSIEDQNEGLARSATEDRRAFIKSATTVAQYEDLLQDPYGGLTFRNCGYVNLPEMLEAYRTFLEKRNLLIDEIYQENLITIHQDHVLYNNIHAEKVIYCNGASGKESKYFKWLPFSLVKGEILKLNLNSPALEKIISRGIYVLPADHQSYHVGATYNWNDLTNHPTEEGKNELLQKVDSLMKCSYELVGHRAGVRPATKDRRPFIGLHPEHKTLGLFNGLGTKGVSLAPYYARQFADYLVHGKELDKDVNLNRFISLYYT